MLKENFEPTPLVQFAGRAVTYACDDTWDHDLPELLQEQVACHLHGEALVNYIEGKEGGLYILSRSFTRSGFQSLLLTVFKQLEESESKRVRVALKKILGDYDVHLREKYPDSSVWNLGLHKRLGLRCLIGETKFFGMLYGIKDDLNVWRFPMPDVPYRLPVQQNEFRHHDTRQHLPAELWAKPVIISNLAVQAFFDILIPMTFAFRYLRSHEVAVYAFQLLANEQRFYRNLTLRRYLFHVYGMLAASLARLQRPITLAYSCLFKMQECICCEADRLIGKYYTQCVYSNYAMFNDEKKMFKELFVALTPDSSLLQQAVDIHFRTKRMEIENIIGCILCHIEVSQHTYFLQIERGLKITRKLSLLFFKILAMNCTVDPFRAKVQRFVEILKLYQIILENICYKDSSIGRDVEGVYYNLTNKGRYTQYDMFLNLYVTHVNSNYDYTIGDYRNDLNNRSFWAEESGHVAESIKVADILFTQFILLRLLGYCAGDSSTDIFKAESERLLVQALHVYKESTKNQSHRLPLVDLLVDILCKERDPQQFVAPLPNCQVKYLGSTFVNCSPQWMLRTDPLLPSIVAFGKETLRAYDF